MQAIFVGGELHGLECEAGELELLTQWTGSYSKSYEYEKAHGILCPRSELWNKPKISGYLGPMWDGDRLRYETQEVYNALSV